MKLSMLMLVCSAGIAWSAESYAQEAKVSLNAQNETVQTVLSKIEDQSEFSFFFNVRHIDLDRRVSLQAEKSDVFVVLDQLFAGTDVTYKVLDRKIILTKGEASQQNGRRVTGKVLDKSGEPIIGANVVVKGTTTGTVTDIDGNFSLEVAEGALLEISYIGYLEQEIKVGNQNNLTIRLSEDTQNLDEVVVVGYGTVKKSDLTGSVSSVKAEELAAFPVSSPAQALQGRTSGVHVKQSSGAPGGSPTVRIRGTNSILGGNDPLYVIDGFPTNSGLALLSSDDIESIEVLKDASFIAIYGSRGSNGVILVTTKKGKSGKTKVDFSTTLGLQKLAKKMDMMNAQEYARFYNERLVNDGKEACFSESEINALGEGFDWQDFVYSTQPIRTHALDISGGTDRTQFTVGANIFDQQGIVGVGSYKRYTLRTDVNHKITDRLKVNVNTTLTRSIDDNKTSQGGRQGATIVSASLLASPAVTPYNEDGTYTVLENCLPFVTTGGALINPLNIMNEESNVTKRNSVLANAAFTYEPIDGLVLKVSGGVENRDGRNDYYKGLEYWNSQGSASVSTSQEISLLNENTISYTKTFAKKHLIQRYPEAHIAIISRPPDDGKTVEDLRNYYLELAKHITCPVIIQTGGGTTYKGVMPPVELLIELARLHPQLFGYIKEESGDCNSRIVEELTHKPLIKTVFSAWGSWQWLYQSRQLGTEGLITERPAYADLIAYIWEQMENGDVQGTLDDAFGRYLLMLNLSNSVPDRAVGGELRGPHLYLLKRRGIFKNYLSRAYDWTGGKRTIPEQMILKDLELSAQQQDEIERRFRSLKPYLRK